MSPARRPRRAGRLSAWLGLALACAAGASASPGAPSLVAAEEALDRSVHLAWSDPPERSALGYELERRQRRGAGWSPWETRPLPEPLSRHADDGSLAPGEYAYRIRGRYTPASGEPGWSAWSAERRVVLHAQCPAPADPGLEGVSAVDRDGDGRLTGRDLELALRACAARGGCVLELLPRVYDDVAIVISNGHPVACQPSRTACLVDLEFPRGLTIQGHGSASVLRSPLWKTPYKPVAVLEIWNRPEIPLALRNLVLDGRKKEQRDPKRGVNEAVSWWHYGFSSWNYWGDHSVRSQGGCLHNVHVRDFMSRGISIADTEDWVLEYNLVEDIGCHENYTPCPGLELPDTLAPGYRSEGVGIVVAWHNDDMTLFQNRIRRATKYGLGLKHGARARETSIRRPRIFRNEISGPGHIGIFLAGVEDGWLSENQIERSSVGNEPLDRSTWYNTFGISCAARVDRTRIERNQIRDTMGIAVNWGCSGTGNAFVQNHIERTCREKNPRRCVPATGNCYDYADIHVMAPAGDLALHHNELRDSGCAAPLWVQGGGTGLFVEIRGGHFARGPHTKRPVFFDRVDVVLRDAVTFDGLKLEFGADARGVVTDSVRVPRRHLRRKKGSRVLVCAQDRASCQERCARPRPPDWCAELE